MDTVPGPYAYSEHHHGSPFQAIPRHMKETLSRRSSDEESLAEEGEATPLLAGSSPEGEAQDGKWYQGPIFVAGVKLGILFIVFTAIVAGTFWFGLPQVDP